MRLQIICEDRLGIAQDVLDILVHHQIDLRGIEIDPVGMIFLHFPNIDFAEFQHLMPEIRRIKGVEDVRTIPFMPTEREQYQLQALLQTWPDPVFSIDTKGKVLLVNDVIRQTLTLDDKELYGHPIENWIQGFNFQHWLEQEECLAQTCRLSFLEQDYLADILPVMVPDQEGGSIMAGAVILLKSEQRLGQQLNVFHQAKQNSFNNIQASSAPMKKLLREARKMAELEAPILIFGETGTGKEVLAKACHQASRRAENAFLALNCASIPDEVAESELFGSVSETHEITPGLFELAEGGTLFLDEVGDMSPQLQSKLLRVLQDGSFRRVGDAKEVSVDVRIICTTQKDLGRMVREAEFREDLYYRLNVLSLTVPALRERKSDIQSLTNSFIKQHSIKLGRKPPKLSRACSDYIQSYPWPGNIRQLNHALYRAISLLDGEVLHKEQIPLPSTASTFSTFSEENMGSLDEEVKRFEKELLLRLYPSYPSTRQLARKLGVSHTAIANKLRDYGINKKSVKV